MIDGLDWIWEFSNKTHIIFIFWFLRGCWGTCLQSFDSGHAVESILILDFLYFFASIISLEALIWVAMSYMSTTLCLFVLGGLLVCIYFLRYLCFSAAFWNMSDVEGIQMCACQTCCPPRKKIIDTWNRDHSKVKDRLPTSILREYV